MKLSIPLSDCEIQSQIRICASWEIIKAGHLFVFVFNWFQICVKGRTWFYIDGSTDPNNWMYHVKVAKSKEEQNMEAYQYYGDIYFRTTKEIKNGAELKVFYSKEYGKRVGFKTGLDGVHVNMGKHTVQPRLSGHIGTGTYPDKWFGRIWEICLNTATSVGLNTCYNVFTHCYCIL